jgi:hypothetical protein
LKRDWNFEEYNPETWHHASILARIFFSRIFEHLEHYDVGMMKLMNELGLFYITVKVDPDQAEKLLIKAENYHGNQLVDHNLAQTYHCQEAH